MIVYLPMFEGLKFPANATMVIEYLIKVATFDLVPTDLIDGEMFYWPETGPYSVNFEMAGTESLYFFANIGFVLYMIYYHVSIALVHACIHKIRNSCKCAKRLHTKIS